MRANPWTWAAGAALALWWVWDRGTFEGAPPAMDAPGEGDAVNPWWQTRVEWGQFPVVHRERADGVDARLQAFLDEWEASGPFRICVSPEGGLRTDELAQARLFARGASRAATLAQTPHGRGGAMDLAPYFGFAPQYADDTGASPGALAGAFSAIGASAKALGLHWGGDFPSYDGGHVELADWKSLPFPPLLTA